MKAQDAKYMEEYIHDYRDETIDDEADAEVTQHSAAENACCCGDMQISHIPVKKRLMYNRADY